MNKEIKYSQSVNIYASKETVWNKLLSKEFYELSWDATLTSTWQPGSPIQFKGVWEGIEYTDKGLVQEIEENKFLQFTYWSSFWKGEDLPEEYCNISFRIMEIDLYSCCLTLTQVGFRDKVHFEETVELWKHSNKILKHLSEKQELLTLNDKIFEEIESVIAKISSVNYNNESTISWTAAQIVEHILMANSGLKGFLTEALFSSEVPYDLNVQRIRDLMLDMGVKYQSPEFLIPAVNQYDAIEHCAKLLNLKGEINESISTMDFEERCGNTEMIPFGYMSVFEWLNFCLFHIQRHVLQLKQLKGS